MDRTMATILIALLLALPGRASADGMSWVYTAGVAGGSGTVGKAVPTVQRAVLARTGESWSLTLEPKYTRPKVGAAWLVPFPHCPTVSPADPRLMAELGLVTSPLFVEACQQTCRCEGGSGGFGCGGAAGPDRAGGDTSASGGHGAVAVDVWQSGTVGNLDFVVLSAQDPADIPRWLEDGGYENPPELAAFVTAHAADYRCYFAAKLNAPADEDDVFPAVRFDLDSRDPPSYPLRMTRLGVPDGSFLDLVLWVVNPPVSPGGQIPIPAGFPVEEPGCLVPGTAADLRETGWRACVRDWQAAHPGGLAVTFHGGLEGRRATFLGDRKVWCGATPGIPGGYESCLLTDSVFQDVPKTFTAEVTAWLQGRTVVTRYEGHLPGTALERDLVFGAAPTIGMRCTADEDCGEAGRCVQADLGSLPSDAPYLCSVACDAAEDCPVDWTCDGACRPPVGRMPTDPDGTAALVALDPVYLAWTGSCGYDCGPICAHSGSGGYELREDGEPPANAGAWGALLLMGVPLGLGAAGGILRRRRGEPGPR